MNPIFQAMSGGMPGPMGNIANMIQQYKQFRANTQGDPQQILNGMLQSGKLSQQQLNQAQMMAQQFAPFFK